MWDWIGTHKNPHGRTCIYIRIHVHNHQYLDAHIGNCGYLDSHTGTWKYEFL